MGILPWFKLLFYYITLQTQQQYNATSDKVTAIDNTVVRPTMARLVVLHQLTKPQEDPDSTNFEWVESLMATAMAHLVLVGGKVI